MEKIIKVRKNTDGYITHVQFKNGDQATIKQAIGLAKKSQIQNVLIGKARDGSETLKSQNNSKKTDNLSKLPTF